MPASAQPADDRPGASPLIGERCRKALLTEAFRDHAAAVHRVAQRIGGANNAADVTQEVFLRFWTYPERFDPGRGALRSYLCTMARGVAIDYTRRDHARVAREDRTAPIERDAGVDPEHAAIVFDDARRVTAELGRLKAEERAAIIAAFASDLSYREAAARLQVPEGTVKSRIRAGLQKLRFGLDDA